MSRKQSQATEKSRKRTREKREVQRYYYIPRETARTVGGVERVRDVHVPQRIHRFLVEAQLTGGVDQQKVEEVEAHLHVRAVRVAAHHRVGGRGAGAGFGVGRRARKHFVGLCAVTSGVGLSYITTTTKHQNVKSLSCDVS